MTISLCKLLFLFVCFLMISIGERTVFSSPSFRPNIVIILADDLGWNDLSFHGSDQIPTPNIDALAYNGLILNSHYVQPQCTPSRSALMTGKYPIHTGMQGMPTLAAEPNGLPLNLKILPEYLRELGYATRAIGKWHLGYYRRNYTPLFRGFDSHLGMFAGFTSYYDYILQDVYNGVEYSGFDLRRNGIPAYDLSGQYATDVFTNEAVDVISNHETDKPLFLYLAHLAVHAGNRGKYLEAPQEEINKFMHIPDPNRRTYAAMVSKLDESVGRVVQALQKKDMLDNTLILFMSDNGAPSTDNAMPSIRIFPNWGSNFPFKGAKETLWEGGVRSPTILWGAQFQSNPRVSTQLMHISDWLPTLYSAAGGDISRLPSSLDGVDQWYSLTWNLPSRRKQVLLNINEKDRNAGLVSTFETASLFKQTWKVVFGIFKTNLFDGHYGDTRSPSNPIYNISSVVSSKVNRALSTLYIPTAHPSQMRALRRQATIICSAGPSTLPRCDQRPCLFNLERDPCEWVDIAANNTLVTQKLYEELVKFRSTLVPQTNKPVDTFGADPRKWNNTWTTWMY